MSVRQEVCKDRTVWKSIVSVYPFWGIGGLASYLHSAPYLIKTAFRFLVNSHNGQFFVRKTIYEYLWDYRESILDTSRSLAPGLVPVDNLGVLARRLAIAREQVKAIQAIQSHSIKVASKTDDVVAVTKQHLRRHLSVTSRVGRVRPLSLFYSDAPADRVEERSLALSLGCSAQAERDNESCFFKTNIHGHKRLDFLPGCFVRNGFVFILSMPEKIRKEPPLSFLLALLEGKLPSERAIYSDFSDEMSVYIGPQWGHERFFQIHRFRGEPQLPGYDAEVCPDRIFGSTEGVLYRQRMTKDDVLLYWRKSVCKLMPLYFDNDERRLHAQKSVTHYPVPPEPSARARARNERSLFHSIGRCVRVEERQRPHTTYT
ncbi:hypothetical protein EVAR_14139_1 [Eumeta japonica]|uniref:Uncharacterized protein n=1 Tax=Eumeta variegata TaxID=151549 RepID=A0A4C1UFS1_EUMVA|nr:hypothetical protein EVAR_14139_1 [Eumeta japonica]